MLLYIILIIVMLGGTAFFVYKSFFSTSVGEPMVAEIPAGGVTNNSEDSGPYNLTEDVSLAEEDGEKTSVSGEKENISPAQEKNEISGLIDLNLLVDSKFKMLEENILKPTNFSVGRNNPFAPY